jgi:hypothetical protein
VGGGGGGLTAGGGEEDLLLADGVGAELPPRSRNLSPTLTPSFHEGIPTHCTAAGI